jgi:hypothetical protein
LHDLGILRWFHNAFYGGFEVDDTNGGCDGAELRICESRGQLGYWRRPCRLRYDEPDRLATSTRCYYSTPIMRSFSCEAVQFLFHHSRQGVMARDLELRKPACSICEYSPLVSVRGVLPAKPRQTYVLHHGSHELCWLRLSCHSKGLQLRLVYGSATSAAVVRASLTALES